MNTALEVLKWISPLLVYLASGLLNLALWRRTPEEWEEYASTNPAGAAAIKLLRIVGLNLPGLIRFARLWLAARQSARMDGPPAPPAPMPPVSPGPPGGGGILVPFPGADPSTPEASPEALRDGEGAEG